ncbi:hypothetical protein SDC9_123834 [bioreactor metagenome]|uniref:Uncharacterized protein n=1 Tax=bioreactor metagenome TaxID=1076179 RepID=A0A645CIQ9_9ZZZZ
MARKQLTQLVVRIFLAGFQNLHGGENEAGGAETALNGGLVHKGLLNVGQLAVGAQKALQRADGLAIRPDRKVYAGVKRLAVDEDVARAAFAHLAALFHRGHAKVVAEHIRQRRPRVHHPLDLFAVEGEADGFILHHMLFHHSAPPASRTLSINPRLALSTAMCSRKSRLARQLSLGLISSFTAWANRSANSSDTG